MRSSPVKRMRTAAEPSRCPIGTKLISTPETTGIGRSNPTGCSIDSARHASVTVYSGSAGSCFE